MIISKKKYDELIADKEYYVSKSNVLMEEVEHLKAKMAGEEHSPGADCEGCVHLVKDDARPWGIGYHCKLNNKCGDFTDDSEETKLIDRLTITLGEKQKEVEKYKAIVDRLEGLLRSYTGEDVNYAED